MQLADGWTYTAIRTPQELYMEMSEARKQIFAPPEIEMYDLEAEPDELHNLARSTDPAVEQGVRDLAARLARPPGCAGIDSRDARWGTAFCE
jgi:hypothetical protein